MYNLIPLHQSIMIEHLKVWRAGIDLNIEEQFLSVENLILNELLWF